MHEGQTKLTETSFYSSKKSIRCPSQFPKQSVQHNRGILDKLLHHAQYLPHYCLYFSPVEDYLLIGATRALPESKKTGGSEANITHLDPLCSCLDVKHLVYAAQDVREILLNIKAPCQRVFEFQLAPNYKSHAFLHLC